MAFLTMLRHGCGYALANAGHDTRAIQWARHENASAAKKADRAAIVSTPVEPMVLRSGA